MKTKIFQGPFFVIALLVLAVLWIPKLALAWSDDPTFNVPICTAPNDQSLSTIVSDGSGGAIITWLDLRNDPGDLTNSDIYAQRVDADGTVLWMENGVPICMAPNHQMSPIIVSDGFGGAIITWFDSRNGKGDIYVQRVDAFGNVLWMENGVPICTAPETQKLPAIVSDGSGGAIITWQDLRNDPGDLTNSDIYAQHIDALGNVLWTENGVPICTALNYQGGFPIIASDSSGGAIIAWEDLRNGKDVDIYAQRVDASGNVLWTENGIPICTATPETQKWPQIVSDGSGGVIITWEDGRDAFSGIYAQRVDALGNVLWTENGVPICTDPDVQVRPKIVSDDSDGAIITWGDGRGGIYVQRVNADGMIQWTIDGVAVCTASGTQEYSTIYSPITSDGSGGAIITWQDDRNGNDDIYAQRVFSDGSLSVELVSFTASISEQGVTLKWRTATEINNLGFNIYRSNTKDGKYVKVNTKLIQGADSDATPHDYSFTDDNVKFGQTYYYYIEDIDFAGKKGKSLILQITVGEESEVKVIDKSNITVRSKLKSIIIPTEFALLQNYPNPFNPDTWIPYNLAADADVEITIYSAQGHQIRTLSLGSQPASSYIAKDRAAYWDGRSDTGELVSSGIYFYHLQAGEFRAAKKMIILK